MCEYLAVMLNKFIFANNYHSKSYKYLTARSEHLETIVLEKL